VNESEFKLEYDTKWNATVMGYSWEEPLLETYNHIHSEKEQCSEGVRKPCCWEKEVVQNVIRVSRAPKMFGTSAHERRQLVYEVDLLRRLVINIKSFHPCTPW
jgi:hypothetical protein